ncbi:hypothetical protein GQ42DRAFT_164781, partial [Ramicandelaber brevisporus]
MGTMEGVGQNGYNVQVPVKWTSASQGALVGNNLVIADARYLTTDAKVAGAYSIVSPVTGNTLPVVGAAIHPNFTKFSDTVYMNPLVLLATAGKIGDGVGIAGPSVAADAGANATALGWCHSGPSRNEECTHIWKTPVAIADTSRCQAAVASLPVIPTARYFCSSTLDNNGCPGEASALLTPDLRKVVGLSLFPASANGTIQCGSNDTLAVYLRYSDYLDWIAATTKVPRAALLDGNFMVNPSDMPQAPGLVAQPSSSPSPSPSPSDTPRQPGDSSGSGSSNTLAIVLGSVGGVLALAIIVLAVLRFKYGKFTSKPRDGAAPVVEQHGTNNFIYVVPMVAEQAAVNPIGSTTDTFGNTVDTFG